MNLSYLTLQSLTEELRQALQGKPVLDAFLVAPHDLYLKVDGAGHLLLSASPTQGRIALSEAPEQTEQTRPSWVERYILRARIETVHQLPLERVVELKLVKRDRLGGEDRVRLICEIMARHSNVVLVSEPKGNILGALRQVKGRMSRQRQILPGKPYLPPPPLNRVPPDRVTPAALEEALDRPPESPEDALVHAVAGLDPLTARELLHRAGIGGGQEASPEKTDRLLQEIRSTFEAPPCTGRAVGLPGLKDHRMEVSVLSLQHIALEDQISFPSVSEAIGAAVREEIVGQRRHGKKLELEKILNHRLSAIHTKVSRIEADLKASERADDHEKYGNILMANLSRVPPRATSVTLCDLFNPEGPNVTIPLDIHKRPVDTAQDYLKRSRKARKSAPILARRLEVTHRQAAELRAHLERLQTLDREADLSAFREDLERLRLIRPQKPKQSAQKRKSGEGDLHPRRYRTSDGWTVLVGRNNKENDRLTRSSARKDIFLHAQGCPGSHVILKHREKSDTPPRTALEEAAGLAAYWSKARGSKVVPVNYTEVRYVQKPRGAAPGLVTIRNEKTLFVTPKEFKRAEDDP